jgi:hypothetical protein
MLSADILVFSIVLSTDNMVLSADITGMPASGESGTGLEKINDAVTCPVLE